MSITRSIMRPIMRPIARGIADGIAAAKRYYWLFGGDYASLQAPDSPVPAAVSPSDYSWLPTGTEFNIKLKVDLAAVDMGVQRFMLSDITTSLPRLYKTGSDKLRLQYDSDGVGTIEQITSATAYAEGDELDIEIQFRSTGTEMLINGDSEGSSSTPAFSPSTFFTLALMGANQSGSSRWNGRIWDVLFEDLGDSSNSRSYAVDEGAGTIIQNSLDTGPFSQSRGECFKGNGVDTQIAISVPVSAGAVLNIDWVCQVDATTNQFFGNSVNGYAANISAAGTLNRNAGSVSKIFVDGVEVASGSFTPTAGQSYTIGFEINTTCTINKVMASSFGDGNNLGAVGRLSITDGTDTYIWDMNSWIDNGNGTATVKNTGNTSSSFDALINNFDPATDTELVAAQTDFIANTDPNWVEV